MNKLATQTGGLRGDTSSRNAVVQTKRITRTVGAGSVGSGPATGRAPRDMVREAEEARLKQQEEEAAQLRAQQAEEARLLKETEDARLRQEQLEEEQARKQEADEARQQKQAEDKRLKEEQAAQARLAKQQADEARAQKSAEDTRLKQQQAEELRLKKQQQAEEAKLAREQAEQARLLKQAEDARIKQQQVDEARLRKQEADEARAQKQADEKLLKQQQAEEAKARKAEQLAQKQAAAASARIVTKPLGEVIEERTIEPVHRDRPGGLPMAVWLGVGGLTVVALSIAAFVFFHKPGGPVVVIPSPSPTPVQDVSPSPTATPVVQQPTAAPMPKEFAFLQGFKPANALVKLNGVTLKLSAQGGKVIVPLSGASAGDNLSVEAPGYESHAFPITPDATEKSQVILHRQQGLVKFVLDGGCDYTTAVFKALSGLPGEQSYVQMSADERAVDFGNGASETGLPTGIYQVVLQGPQGASDPKVQPYVLNSRLSVTSRSTSLPLPPTFAGRYDFHFSFLLDPAMPAIAVERTLVIDPGLSGGHVDDQYPGDAGAKPATDTKITDITVDATGKLRGLIRWSLRGVKDNMSYDEQFELSYVDGHFQMVCGGWEVMPTDPNIRKTLQTALKSYMIHSQRPPAQIVMKK